MDIRQNEIINQTTKQSQGLVRTLGIFDVICMGLNSIIGAGIFLLAGQLHSLVGSASLLVFPLCGILCFTVALCFAEMGGMHNQTGGAYLYAKDTFGPFIGFSVGWVMWLSSIIGWASVASGFGLYLKYFLPAGNVWLGKIIIAVFITGLSTINYFGVKLGAKTINFFTIGKLVSLVIFAGVGAFFIKKGNFNPLQITGEFGTAAIIAMYAFTGFEFIVVPAGEMKQPQSNIPRVLLFVLVSATIFYIIIQAVATGTFPGLASSERPLADAARYFMGPAGGLVIGIGALFSIGGINAGIALTGPRNLYVLSHDGFLPKIFSRIHSQYHTPYIAIGINTSLTLLLSLTGSFQYLIAASVMASILQYIPTCLAVIILRRKKPELKRTYRIPGGYCIPAFALIICGWMLYHIEPKVLVATAIAIVLSLPFYYKRKSV